MQVLITNVMKYHGIDIQFNIMGTALTADTLLTAIIIIIIIQSLKEKQFHHKQNYQPMYFIEQVMCLIVGIPNVMEAGKNLKMKMIFLIFKIS